MTIPSLFDEPAIDAAGEHANSEWYRRAMWVIRTMLPGHTFLAEEVSERTGAGTHDGRAMGHVIRSAVRDGLIEDTGRVGRAKTSHGQRKPLWRRTGEPVGSEGGR